MRNAVNCFWILVIGLLYFVPAEGAAQDDPAATVISLNQKAMSDYQNMKITEAVETLQEAEMTCLQFGLVGHEIALTYLNMGVIEAAGNQNETAAIDYFTRAVCIEKSINLDPLVSTPEVESLFSTAKTKAASPGTCNPNMIGGLVPPPPGGSMGLVPPPPGPGVPPPPLGGYAGPVPQSDNVRHEPVSEQEKMTPIPLYIQIRPGVEVDKVILFYRTYGERSYQQFVMAPMGEGYGVTIGCNVLQTFDPAAIEYYIGAMDAGGMVVGFAGNEAQPFSVNIVPTLGGTAPAFPGSSPPDKCVAECPPWNPDCNAGACKQYGDLCDRNSDCCKGMVCTEQTCTPGESGEDEGDSGPFKPRFRMGMTFGTGGGYIPTDYVVPENRVGMPPKDVWMATPGNIQDCAASGYGSDMEGCYKDNAEGLNINGGIAWSKLHFRLSPTLYITEKLMISLNIRGGLPLATSGDLLPVAPIGLLSVGYRIVGSGKDRVELTANVGLGGGLMYHKLSYKDCNPVLNYDGHPWYPQDTDGMVCDEQWINPNTTEWVGPRNDPATGQPNAYDQTYFRTAGYFVGEVGLDFIFWAIRNFGINVGIAVDVLAAPNFAVNGDFQAGVAMRF